MRYIPDDNLSYPILLTLDDNSSGSGFFLNYKDEAVYIVTARHVLFKQDESKKWKIKTNKLNILSYDKDISITDPYTSEVDFSSLSPDSVKSSDLYDLAIIKIGTLNKISGEEDRFQSQNDAGYSELGNPINGKGLVVVPSSRFKKYEEVMISNEVIIFGYPVSLGTGLEIDYKRPLLRKGIVGGKNINNRTIILDCPSYQGNSGGLVLEIDPERRMSSPIGIISGFIPFIEVFKSTQFGYENRNVENSGYSVVTPIDVIFDLIKE